MKKTNLWIKRIRTAVILALIPTLVFLSACNKKQNSAGVNGGSADSTPVPTLTPVNLTEYYTDENQSTVWDNETACAITLNGTSVSIGGTGAYGQGTNVTINQPGTYIISGTATDQRIVIDCSTAGTVRIVLNNADITSATSCPLYVKECEKTILLLAAGSTNTLTDAASYTYDDVAEEEPSACIFSKDDLYINGNGSLTIRANFNDAIQSKDDLVILGGNIGITSADDGLIGKDMVLISGGTLTITAEGDGVKSTNDESTEVGVVMIEGGSLDITTGGGSKNSSASGSGSWGQWGSSASIEDTASAKGIKANTGLVITGGIFCIDSSDDSLHTNGNMEISGGTFTISSGDDGIHADTSLVISDCDMNITKSYEGLEGANITISGGTINITSSDDGMNAAGGADASSLGGRPGQNNFGNAGSYFIKFEGGKITIDAGGDGIDANGKIYMTGGEVYVSGPSDNGNSTLDYDGSFEISGGILIAAGSTGMAQSPTGGSQYSISATFGKSQSANAEITLLDSDGNTLVSFTPTKQFQNVVISCPDLEKSGTYSVSANGTSAGTCTISDTISYIGSSIGMGGSQNGAPGGFGGFGGGRR